jgi:hypothetical protein
MDESTITAMSSALGGEIPFLPARTDFNLLDAILIQPRSAAPMVAASVNLADDSPEDLGLEVEALKGNISLSFPGDITLMNGEAAKRTITASFGGAAAAVSLTNSQQSAVELILAISNTKTESIWHRSYLQDFLKRNIIKFLEENPSVGDRILGRQALQAHGTQRMALGFVARCTTANVVMSQTVDNTSSNQADGRAGGGLENSENRKSTYFNEKPAVVAVKLVVCLLEKRPNQDKCKLGVTTIHGPDSVQLRETMSWVSTGGLRKIAQAIAGLAERRMPTIAEPTLVFPTFFLWMKQRTTRHLMLRETIQSSMTKGLVTKSLVITVMLFYFWKIVRQVQQK